MNLSIADCRLRIADWFAGGRGWTPSLGVAAVALRLFLRLRFRLSERGAVMPCGPRLAAILFPFVLLLSGCVSSFDREWNHSAVGGRTGADWFAGRWEGQWLSQKHRKAGGPLRCVLTKQAPDQYRASFKAGWLVFSSHYSTIFQTKPKDHALAFRGKEDLGFLFGGLYTFQGAATPAQFVASYDSRYDRGTFEMSKVPETGGGQSVPHSRAH